MGPGLHWNCVGKWVQAEAMNIVGSGDLFPLAEVGKVRFREE